MILAWRCKAYALLTVVDKTVVMNKGKGDIEKR